MAFCCDLTCEVITTHIQANRDLRSVQLTDPLEYLSNSSCVHLAMQLPTQVSQLMEIPCLKIWERDTFENILEVKILQDTDRCCK